MKRLNIFNPYQSKSGEHEDQLTRAFLVLLKLSGHAFSTFVEYCRSSHSTSGNEKPISVNDLLEQDWEIETQRANPEIKTKHLLSILITDSKIKSASLKVQRSKRNARYDGIITFGGKLTMIIENKPRAEKVWIKQLKPAERNLAKDIKIYEKPVILEWKEIIQRLNQLQTSPSTAGHELILIDDFLEYVDEKHSYLNPYDKLHLCKRNKELIIRRIENLLKAISSNQYLVNCHHGESLSYYIQTPYPAVERVCLGLAGEGDESSLNLALCFGDTQRQARAFYESKPDISHLQNTLWNISPNFHVAFMTKNLFRFDTDNKEHYLQYWKENVEKIHQQKRVDVPKYMKRLVDEEVIKMPVAAKAKLKQMFYDTEMQTLNICPGFELRYTFNISEAEELDKNDKLKLMLVDKIKEGLRVVGRDGHEFIKTL